MAHDRRYDGDVSTAGRPARRSRRTTALFGVACVRATNESDNQRRLRKAVEAADNGEWVEVARLHEVAAAACGKVRRFSASHYWALAALWLTAEQAETWAVEVPRYLIAAVAGPKQRARGLRRAYADILRDIAGNPFRPATLDPSWRTDTVVALARGMYESRDFGAMPILADALQDAGCESDDILVDRRDAKQVHVRGCWVVDLVLEKA